MIPVSLSDGVEPGARTGTSASGIPLVVWRGQDGVVRAWADRCPHRGMRLSFGFVRENHLACVYHGWSFGDSADTGATDAPTARCVAVPAHPSMTPSARAAVPAFPVAEALGMIWVGTHPGDTEPPQAVAGMPETVYPVRSITVPASAAELHAAIEASAPPGTETAEVAEADSAVITFKGPALRVVAAIQDRGGQAASAHFVTTESDGSLRKELCLWAALVRDHLAAVVLP